MHSNTSVHLLLDGKADIEVQGESGGILLWHLTVFSLSKLQVSYPRRSCRPGRINSVSKEHMVLLGLNWSTIPHKTLTIPPPPPHKQTPYLGNLRRGEEVKEAVGLHLLHWHKILTDTSYEYSTFDKRFFNVPDLTFWDESGSLDP